MNLNSAGVNLIKSFEKCRLTAYQDSGRVWTIGWGSTGRGIGMDTEWTQEQADDRLMLDIATTVSLLRGCIKCTLSDNEFSAIVSLVYNIGIGNFRRSTLLTKINSGDVPGAADEFQKWDIVAGKPSPGLMTRRLVEKALFVA